MTILNILPFQISFNGELPTNIYFHSDLNEENLLINAKGRFSTTFRGKKLNGCMIKPSNYSILISFLSNKEGRDRIVVEKEIDCLIYWNEDDEPDILDDVPQIINVAYLLNIVNSET